MLGDLYLKIGDTEKAFDKYQASLTISEELRLQAPNSVEYARDLVLNYYKILNFQKDLGNYQEQNKYSTLCKDALLYMKNKGMYLDEPLVSLLSYLQGDL